MPRSDRLRVFAGRSVIGGEQEDNVAAPLPDPSGVLYAHPNPDGSRKMCGNCWAWVTSNQCLIHDQALPVPASAVCGYHVYGAPKANWEERGVDPVYPDVSGLVNTDGGTSCDTCTWYEGRAAGGLCSAVADPVTGAPPVPVEAKGCCARWAERLEETI